MLVLLAVTESTPKFVEVKVSHTSVVIAVNESVGWVIESSVSEPVGPAGVEEGLV